MRARMLAIVAVTALAALCLGWLARAPYDPPGGDAGLLRLSWRLRGERIETCRARTPAELDALPAHMRTPQLCAARLVAYRLIVQVDDQPADTTPILPGGARADRPIYILRELPLAPGAHRIRVSFARADTSSATAPALAIDAMVTAAPGVIELVTLDPAATRLIHKAPRVRR